MIMTRRGPEPSRWQMILIQPAHAVVVYALMVCLAAAVAIGAVAYVTLTHRIANVCEPLRVGQHLGSQATTKVGHDLASTFGHSADSLGCAK